MIENIPQEQITSASNITKPSRSRFWLVILLALTSVISGGGVYLWQQNVIKQKEITWQNQTIAEPTINQQDTTVQTLPTPDDGRILLTQKVLDEMYETGKLCNLHFDDSNSDSEVVWLEYKAAGIKFNYPYSRKWGDNQYRVPQTGVYVNGSNQTVLDFGYMMTGVEGCGTARQYQMIALANTSIDTLKKSLSPEETKISSINGYRILEWIEPGEMLSQSHVFLEGKNNVYRFSRFGGSVDEPEFQTILKSVQLD